MSLPRAYVDFHADLPSGLLSAISGLPKPAYVLDVQRVRQRSEALKAALERSFPRASAGYPYKVNPIREVARAAVGVYGFAEVGTAEEFDLARAHGCSSTQCFVGGVGKPKDLLRRAVSEGATLKIDSLEELRRLDAIWHSLEVHDQFRALLRVALPTDDGWSRFGLTPDEVSEVLLRQDTWGPYVRGAHFHAGTDIRDPDEYVAATRRCIPVLRELTSRTGDRYRPILDVGGGFPSCVDEEVASTVERYLCGIASVLDDHGWQSDTAEILCEPGRITAERAGYLVATVIETREQNGRLAAIINAGSTLAGGSWSTVRPGRAAVFLTAAPPGDSCCDIYGNLCFEEDQVAKDAVVIRSASLDSLAIVGDVGAYRLAAAAPWMQELPAVYAIANEQLTLVRGAWRLQAFS